VASPLILGQLVEPALNQIAVSASAGVGCSQGTIDRTVEWKKYLERSSTASSSLGSMTAAVRDDHLDSIIL